MDKLTISEITEKTGVSKRTVHYYIGRGLLPPAEKDEDGYYYTQEHLTKILYIRWLAARHVSLQGIAFQMQGRSGETMEREMAENRSPAEDFNMAPDTAAPDVYIRKTLLPGLEIHMTPEVYERLRYKMDTLAAYLKKLSQEG